MLFLVRRFVKNYEDTGNAAVRASYGKLAGVVGILLNLFLSSAKILAGALTGAISILSDGINNLSDAASSLITLLGFKLAGKKPDRDHPYGHGRMEYFAGLAVSVVILIVAFELFTDSLQKIVNGESVSFSSGALAYVSLGILVLSILVKLWMALFNRRLGRMIRSVAMEATALDSISDCVSTAVVLLSTLLSLVIPDFPLDGIAGLLVSVFIAYTGIRSVKDVADILMGSAPDPAFVKEVAHYVLSFDPRVVGIHDLQFHDYGPGRQLLILHVEVPAEGNILQLHDMIDNIEHGLESNFSCAATIHMDPVITESERLTALREHCRALVREIDPAFDLHDFRMNEGDTHANLIFDVVIPRTSALSPEEVAKTVAARIRAEDPHLQAIVTGEYSLI